MEIDPFSPADLVERIRGGDNAAEGELVDRYSRGVFFVINQQVSDRSEAEDVYQETFLLVLEKVRAGQLREPERLSGFILSIARNLVVAHFRKATRADARRDASNHPIPVREPSQLQRLLRNEQAELARRVLAALPSQRDRDVLHRFYIAGQEKDEICAGLGITSLHFNQILFRARDRYRRIFEEMSGSPP